MEMSYRPMRFRGFAQLPASVSTALPKYMTRLVTFPGLPMPRDQPQLICPIARLSVSVSAHTRSDNRQAFVDDTGVCVCRLWERHLLVVHLFDIASQLMKTCLRRKTFWFGTSSSTRA